MRTCKCFSCGGDYPDVDGPVHRYMTATPGCWKTYGDILAREYSNPEYFRVHRLSVDAYAVQHPGSTDRQSIHSVGLHLIRLCLFIEHELPPEDANDAMLAAAERKHSFFWLEPPPALGDITAADVIEATDPAAHRRLVTAWAQGAWSAWSIHHDTIRTWLPNPRA